MDETEAQPSDISKLWPLDPSVKHLNHGSFGACPREVLAYQQAIRDRFEASPVPFVTREMRPLFDAARRRLAETVGADAAGIVAVSNATSGVNTVLRSLQFDSRDEIVVTNHGYNACNNAVHFVAQRSGGVTVKVAEIPFPVSSEQEIVDAVLSQLTSRTRLVVIDHVTSPTGLILPLKPILDELNRRGIESLVDGAHAPGMIPLELELFGATYYTGNCHKWLCSPKSVGFLYVAEERRDAVVPLVISHGWNTARAASSHFQDQFDWPGTFDPSVWLSVPVAIDFLERLLPGGLAELQQRNHQLVVEARRFLCERLDVAPLCPESMLGAMATLLLPEADQDVELEPDETAPTPSDPWVGQLLQKFGIDVPVFQWNHRRYVRVSAQVYNHLDQYRALGDAILELHRTEP